jgi:hypothetical protein
VLIYGEEIGLDFSNLEKDFLLKSLCLVLLVRGTLGILGWFMK